MSWKDDPEILKKQGSPYVNQRNVADIGFTQLYVLEIGIHDRIFEHPHEVLALSLCDIANINRVMKDRR